MRYPGEWEPHERTIMGWPCRESLWGPTLEQARADYAFVANSIADFEDVTMIAGSTQDAHDARAACTGRVQIVELPIDDSWLRDSGPIYTVDDAGGRVAVHFGFNSWGEKFAPWDKDAEIGGLIARELGHEVQQAPLVLEGGSVISDGNGTILTTEQCLLSPNRNPSLSRDAIEQLLAEWLGAERLVWLGLGLAEDRDTDGHVDLIAAFTPDRRALAQTVPSGGPNHERCAENLQRMHDAGIETIEIPHLTYTQVAGELVAVGYLNLYICNDAVIVPTAGHEFDEEALAIIGDAFPGRSIVPVPGATIAYGGGGPHCITQQVPAV
ncbi:MAG TPA: agmatine deiminase family protein [Solirubrobacteraceae bacterium]|jgi:agmatine deiminase|nr:agmatine deiminase family protein [Solirubrobacteraceae bacterium]